ncbi:hypothetical protein CEUSTIGMA_g8913.t1 [Chlamydomonas eustigma]|uniref:Uncharacterized protein n=1 Tax=Chlamydomonas eustigma TaxID=1157962 RepID=A0A250XEH3_9CHLO|nr:hypothetical protein CEUSTIGMA_g8913.t1 [Chlamydomonas eustigma]|eukprot:GAX81484.1 hypothetical protein CEUSTIGMA_g8913.t1 [Chlamydomonas eustigma]
MQMFTCFCCHVASDGVSWSANTFVIVGGIVAGAVIVAGVVGVALCLCWPKHPRAVLDVENPKDDTALAAQTKPEDAESKLHLDGHNDHDRGDAVEMTVVEVFKSLPEDEDTLEEADVDADTLGAEKKKKKKKKKKVKPSQQ